MSIKSINGGDNSLPIQPSKPKISSEADEINEIIQFALDD